MPLQWDLTLERLVLQAEHAGASLAPTDDLRFVARFVGGRALAWPAGPLECRHQLFRTLPADRLATASQRGDVGGFDAAGGRIGAHVRARGAGFPGDGRLENLRDGKVQRQVRRPDRTRDRPARHPAQRRGTARRDSRPPRQGDARHRGPALLRALRRRRARHGASARHEPECGRDGAGRLDADPAARQEPVPVVGTLADAQAEGAVPLVLARGTLHQAADPQALFRPRLHGRRRVRRRGRRAVLLRQVGAGRHALRGGDDGRPLQGADEVRSAYRPSRVPRTGQRGALEPGRGRFHDGGPGAAGAAQSGTADRHADGEQPGLVSGLGLRRGAAHRRRTWLLRAHGARDGRPQDAASGRGSADLGAAPGRQSEERQVRSTGLDGAGRRRARHGRRRRLRREPVQPRDACPPPAGIVVQALCVCERRRARPDAVVDGARFGGLVWELVAEELRRQHGRPRRHTDGASVRQVAQYDGGRVVAQIRPRERHQDDAEARRARCEKDVLDGPRRRRRDGARTYRRLRNVRQRWQAHQALRRARAHELPRRGDLLARAG